MTTTRRQTKRRQETHRQIEILPWVPFLSSFQEGNQATNLTNLCWNFSSWDQRSHPSFTLLLFNSSSLCLSHHSLRQSMGRDIKSVTKNNQEQQRILSIKASTAVKVLVIFFLTANDSIERNHRTFVTNKQRRVRNLLDHEWSWNDDISSWLMSLWLMPLVRFLVSAVFLTASQAAVQVQVNE